MGTEGEGHTYHGINTPLDKVRIVFSLFLVSFSVVLVLANISKGNTQWARDISPIFAGIFLWCLIGWMTMVEGGQCSMVGLPPIDRELYRESHPITYKITGWGHKGDQLDRYLMGRQFMVIFLNFMIGLCGGVIDPEIDVFNLPDWVKVIFLGSGIGMVLQNVIIGQLTSQVNASHCMLDYINNHFMTFTYWVTVIIEFSGVVHASYLIRIMAYWAAGKPVESNEPEKEGFTLYFYWGRIVWSVAILGFALAVTIEALFRGATSLWAGVPEIIGLVLFFVLMCCVGLLEGMQIAFFTVAKLPKSERGDSKLAMKVCHTLFKNGGKNLPGFMCGRQMTVTLCFFVIARVTTINIKIGEEPNIFGVSDPIQGMFNLGFMGALTTTILGSIAWQLVAGAFPIGFLSNPIVYIFLMAALFLEATGICAAAWFFALIQKKVMKFQFDEVYVGTAEERAAKGHADEKNTGGALAGVAALAGNEATGLQIGWADGDFTDRRNRTLTNITEIRNQMDMCESEDEKEAFQMALKMEVQQLERVNAEQEQAMAEGDNPTKGHSVRYNAGVLLP